MKRPLRVADTRPYIMIPCIQGLRSGFMAGDALTPAIPVSTLPWGYTGYDD